VDQADQHQVCCGLDNCGTLAVLGKVLSCHNCSQGELYKIQSYGDFAVPYFSFRLLPDFIEKYKDVEPPFGFRDAGGNSLGELTFLRTYSNLNDDGTKERWLDTCVRVTNGTYSIQKSHAKANKLEWNDQKGQSSAKEFFDRMFNLKWTPPGRGLEKMGSKQVMDGNSASLQNCAVISTGDIDRNDPGAVFQWAMLALMYGVGVGADMLGAKKNIEIRERVGDVETFVVPDSREGWAESLRLLINSYLRHNAPVAFDYSLIRPKGAPLKAFGGLASGPEPLVMLHDRLEVIFEKRIGKTLDSETIVDIFNMIGACVIAGSTRRSAEIMLGDYGDTAFLDLKNSSVYPERNSYDPENPGWAWASNNSINVPVGADYEQYLDLIVNNGEPGFVWLDVAKSRGRMMDAPDDKDRRVVGFNPCCLSPDTTIMTSNGPRKISEIDSEFVAVVDGIEYNAKKPWISGVGDIYRLTTKEGFEIELTKEHMLMTESGEWKQAHALSTGDRIKLNDHGSLKWGDANNFGDGYLIGQFVGDGNFSSHGVSKRNRGSVKIGDATYKAEAKLWDIAGDDFDAAEYMEKVASQYATRSDWSGWSQVSDRPYQMMTITNVVRQYNLNPFNKHDITVLEGQSSEFYKGFLKGLFDADGHIEGYHESTSYKGLSIRLGQSNYKMLQVVQRMLLRLGINSKIYKARNAGQSWLPDGKGDYKYYNTKASYRLVISADSALKYANEIGFMHRSKAEKLEHALSWRKQKYTKPLVATVQSLDFVRRGEVWDTEVETVHAFDANGFYAHNSEQPLESQEMCTLVTVHLQNAESKEDFLRTLKFAFLYAKTVTLVPTPWTKTNSVMQRNRRIGLSLTGITDVIDERGLPEILEWMDAGYQEVRRLDKIYSEWLCVRESNRVTTIKPEGTVSLLSGASPGIHWGPGGKYYMRAIRFGGSDKMIPLFRAAGYKIERDLVSHDTYVVYFPVKSNAHRSEREVSVFEKIGLAAKAQHYWSDNGVSVTVSFDKEAERHLLVPALRLHEGSLKAVSFLPMSNAAYPQQPYTQITEDEYNSYVGSLKKIDFSAIYDGVDNLEAVGDRYCSNDTCSI
jgi:intein/homing endonuclease